MRNIKLHLVDTFSGCKDVKIKEVTNKQFEALQLAKYKGITIPEFSNNIRYNWLIKRIEPINKDHCLSQFIQDEQDLNTNY